MTSHYGFDLHSQMTNDVQHLFMHLLVICMSSLEKSLSSLPMFKMELSFMCCVFTFSPPSLLLLPPAMGVDPKGTYTVGKHSAIALHPRPSFYFSSHNFH